MILMKPTKLHTKAKVFKMFCCLCKMYKITYGMFGASVVWMSESYVNNVNREKHYSYLSQMPTGLHS